MQRAATVVTFNVGWATGASPRGRALRRAIDRAAPDVVCLTEAHAGWFGDTGYEVASAPDYGLGPQRTRRKVVLWSRAAWIGADRAEQAPLPSGRFVSARTATPAGEVAVCGVCIPYDRARVRQGATPWSEHLRFLEGLPELLPRSRGVVLGDFNQAVPRRRAPRPAYAALQSALSGMTLATAGLADDQGAATIDHVACTPDLRAGTPEILGPYDEDGHRLSDHVGIVVRFFTSC